jgi:hypothetical protein
MQERRDGSRTLPADVTERPHLEKMRRHRSLRILIARVVVASPVAATIHPAAGKVASGRRDILVEIIGATEPTPRAGQRTKVANIELASPLYSTLL